MFDTENVGVVYGMIKVAVFSVKYFACSLMISMVENKEREDVEEE